MNVVGLRLGVLSMICLQVFLCLPVHQASARQQADTVVSLVVLLTNPVESEGQIVEVVGYLSRDVGLTLYLTEDHAKAYDIASAIAIEEPNAQVGACAGAYVRLVGKFGKSTFGDFGILKTLSVLRQMSGTDKFETCWERSTTAP